MTAIDSTQSEGVRGPEQQALKNAHANAKDLALIMADFPHEPSDQQYAFAARLATALAANLSTADYWRRLSEVEGIDRA